MGSQKRWKKCIWPRFRTQFSVSVANLLIMFEQGDIYSRRRTHNNADVRKLHACLLTENNHRIAFFAAYKKLYTSCYKNPDPRQNFKGVIKVIACISCLTEDIILCLALCFPLSLLLSVQFPFAPKSFYFCLLSQIDVEVFRIFYAHLKLSDQWNLIVITKCKFPGQKSSRNSPPSTHLSPGDNETWQKKLDCASCFQIMNLLVCRYQIAILNWPYSCCRCLLSFLCDQFILL